MYRTDLALRIAQEQREKMVAATESAAVTLFGVVTGALLPQMIYQYLITSGDIIDPPAYLQYIPHVGYGLAALVFVNALVGNLIRSRRIRVYKQELQMMAYMDECDCGECEECLASGKDEVKVVAAKPSNRPAVKTRKTVTRKAVRKTTKKSAK